MWRYREVVESLLWLRDDCVLCLLNINLHGVQHLYTKQAYTIASNAPRTSSGPLKPTPLPPPDPHSLIPNVVRMPQHRPSTMTIFPVILHHHHPIIPCCVQGNFPALGQSEKGKTLQITPVISVSCVAGQHNGPFLR